jgi:mono/diheme cytochrome c family protein
MSRARRYGSILLGLIVLGAAAMFAIVLAFSPGRLPFDPHAVQMSDPQSYETIERGRYLATVGDCAACHTAPGGKPFAGGLAIATPFGTLVATNVTPDPATGIGAWTDEEFVRAVREGIDRAGAYLYPAMPYTAYTKVSRDDVLAIRAYLRTVEPVSHKVEANQLPFPFNIRSAMLGWNLLNFKSGAFEPDADVSAEQNRGAYLVQGLGHCGTCHSAKNILGGDKRDGFLHGAMLQGWLAPNITADTRTGIGAWSLDEIVDYLKAGANHWTLVAGPMAEEVRNSSAAMTDADLHAIAVYLKSLNGGTTATPQPIPAADTRMTAGQAIYQDVCSACHGGAGLGAERLFPKLAGSAVVQADDPTTLIRVVVAGSRAGATSIAPTAPAMPAMAGRLTDDQVASALTYIRNAWGNAAAAVSPDQVSAITAGLARGGD